jgi:alpha-glucosidase
VAYRFLSSSKDSIVVKDEVASFNFPANHLLYFPEVSKRDNADIYHTSFEEPYKIKPLDSVLQNSLSFTPVLIATAAGPKMVITGIRPGRLYPGMFIKGNGTNALSGHFAPYPLEEKGSRR